MSFHLPHIESLLLEITHSHNFIIGTIYRPPNASIGDLLYSFEYIVDTVKSYNIPFYIVGDFNLNLHKHKETNVVNIINIFYSHSFFPTITEPTRVTKTSASIIDHLWINNLHNYQSRGIIYTSISDHFPIFSTFSLPNSHSPRTFNTVNIRNYADDCIEAFKVELSSFGWKLVTTDFDVDNL